MPAHRDIPVHTVISLMGTADLMRSKGIPFEMQIQHGGSIVSFARTKAAHTFLQSDKNRLFWIDSDMEWNPDDFLKLLALSTRLEVVGGIYVSKSEQPTFFINYDNPEIEIGPLGCFEIAGMGLGFTCVQRSIMEELAQRAPRLKFPDLREPIPHIFRIDECGVEARGEDMAFFADIRALGHKVWACADLTLGHIGPKIHTANFLEMMKEQNERARSEARPPAAAIPGQAA